MSDDQPAWAKRMENKLDALLEALRQMGYVQEVDGNMINETFGSNMVTRRHPMQRNRDQMQKVIAQGLAGEAPKIDE